MYLVTRAIYKDFVCLLQRNEYLDAAHLKNKVFLPVIHVYLSM